MLSSTRTEGLRSAAIVDDDDDCRLASETVLTRAGWKVTPFSTARSAVAALKTKGFPKLVLMDMQLPGESAPRAIAAIRRARPETPIVVLSSFQRDDYIFDAIRAGAVGYVLKERDLMELPSLLELVLGGGSPLSPGIARRLLENLQEPTKRDAPLSTQELAIVQLFAQGKAYEETAQALGISIDTVRTHVRRMYKKLHVTSRTEAVVRALKRGWLR